MLQTLLTNSLIALVVATIAWAVQRRWRRPELLHLLWMVVLVKLITPGYFELKAIPLAPRVVAEQALLPQTDLVLPIPSMTPAAASGFTTIDWSVGVLPLLATGAVLLCGWSLIGAWRFSKLLRLSRPFDQELQDRLERQANLVGVRTPRGRILDARVPPMLWGFPWRARVLLPQALLHELSPLEIDTLITHELVHLKRGDGWVRWLELLVLSACWWNPLAWWARSNLRSAEEQACDAQVLRLMPKARRHYADAILKTMEFLAGYRPTPALATGVDGTRELKERLTMILDRTQRKFRSPALPWLMVALLALPIVPGFAERDDREADKKKDAQEQRVEEQHQRAMLELEEKQLQLQREMMEVELQREDLERSLETMQIERHEMELQRNAASLRRDGHQQEADQMLRELEQMRERVAQEHVMRDQMRDSQRLVMQQEREMHEKLIALERARRNDDSQAAEAYEHALAEQKRALSMEVKASQKAEKAYEKAMMKQAVEDMREQLEQFEEMAEHADADERAAIDDARQKLTAEMKRLKQELSARQDGVR
jgi:beta-lactamase regulating signal transducer with metallopeptidase domain